MAGPGVGNMLVEDVDGEYVGGTVVMLMSSEVVVVNEC